jgi:hypothetical protein
MDLHMAVGTSHIVDEMGAGVMFGTFDLMTSVAGDRLDMDSAPLSRVDLDIGDIPVAAITGIGSMKRFGEFGHIDIFMALQTFGVVDTLQTVFPSADLILLLGELQLLMEFQFLSGADHEEGKKGQEEKER